MFSLVDSDGAVPVTVRRAKQENGGLGEDPPGSPRPLGLASLGGCVWACLWEIGRPGGSSPRPPFSRFARRAVVGRANLLSRRSDLDVQSRQ
jgi:hypothetical protein